MLNQQLSPLEMKCVFGQSKIQNSVQFLYLKDPCSNSIMFKKCSFNKMKITKPNQHAASVDEAKAMGKVTTFFRKINQNNFFIDFPTHFWQLAWYCLFKKEFYKFLDNIFTSTALFHSPVSIKYLKLYLAVLSDFDKLVFNVIKTVI